MPNFLAKLSTIFQVLVLSTLPGFSCANTATQAPVEIRVGIFAPFSNENAFIGRNILGAMQLAEEQSAKSHVNYLFYTLDKSPETPVTAATLQKFIKAHNLNVLLTEGESSGVMAAPVAKTNNIIHFNIAKNAQIADGKNNFIAWNADYESAAILDHKAKPQFVAQYLEMHKSNPIYRPV
jgi:branched-chain amino acid transport system substrate-binding protein